MMMMMELADLFLSHPCLVCKCDQVLRELRHSFSSLINALNVTEFFNFLHFNLELSKFQFL